MARTFAKSKKSNLSAMANTSSITTTWATKGHTPSLSSSKTARFSLTSWTNLFLRS
jgi:hypothetical protein